MKHVLIILSLILCFFTSRHHEVTKAELEELEAQAKLEKQNKELARKMIDAWSKNDFETMKEILARIMFSTIHQEILTQFLERTCLV